MRCQAIVSKLSEYLAGELSPRTEAAVRGHLASCARCRAEAEGLARVEQVLAGLAVGEPAPDLLEDLRVRLAGTRPARSYRWAWAGAAAVALVGVAGGLASLRPAARQLPVAPQMATSPPKGRPEAQPSPDPAPAGKTEGAAQADARVLIAESPRPARRVARKPKLSERRAEPEPRAAEVAAEQPGMQEAGAEQASSPGAAGGGVVLLLGEPKAAPPSSSLYLEVTMPDGERSVVDQTVERDAYGDPRVVQISYQQSEAGTAGTAQGG